MFENNLYDCVEYRCHESYSCDISGCYEEGICRCSVIESVEITSINLSKLTENIYSEITTNNKNSDRENKLINVFWGYQPQLINRWCIDRLLSINKVWDVDNIEYKVQNGYYGEEVENFSLKTELYEKLDLQIDYVLGIDPLKEKLFYLLNLEYGSILETLVDKDFTIQVIDKSKIYFPKENHKIKVDSKILNYYKRYNLPSGLVIKKGDLYHVVDGYHRLSASTSKKITVIVGE